MKINELIDAAKVRANIASDYALAKALNIDRRNVSDWRKGKKHPNNAEAVQLATLAGIDELRVIAEIEKETANTPEKRKFWEHFIEQRGIAATLALTVLAGSIIVQPEAEASVLHFGDYSDFNQSEIYIMRNRRSQKRLVLRALLFKWLELVNPYYSQHNYKIIMS